MNEIFIEIDTRIDDSYINVSKTTTTPGDVLKGKLFYDKNGELREGEIEEKSIEINPSKENQVIKNDELYNEIFVNKVTSDIDSNIQPFNIKEGVNILGVTGNMAPDKPDQSKTVVPNENTQRVIADNGYELSEVIVEGIPQTYVGSGITKKASQTYKVSEEERIIQGGIYLLGDQIIEGIDLDEKTVVPTTNRQVITSNADGLREVIIEPIPGNFLNINLPENIYSGEVEVENATD